MRKAFPAIPRNWTRRSAESKTTVHRYLAANDLADSKRENVVLLEIEPEKQKNPNRFRGD